MTAEVQQVLAAFHPQLREAIQLKARTEAPKSLIAAIEKQLAGEGRVPVARLVARVTRRWSDHRYAEHFSAGTLKSPVGTAIAMLKPGPCPEPRCEDGKFEDGSACRACIERDKNYRGDRDRERKAAAEQKAAAARRQACPHCKLDRGTAGNPCSECTEAITSTERHVAALVEQALADHLAIAKPGDGQAEAASFRSDMSALIDQARTAAVAKGANALGQCLAVRFAADDHARRLRLLREQAATHEGALAAGADRPKPPAAVDIPAQASADNCLGHDGSGCPSRGAAVGHDRLCWRCRVITLERDTPLEAPAH